MFRFSGKPQTFSCYTTRRDTALDIGIGPQCKQRANHDRIAAAQGKDQGGGPTLAAGNHARLGVSPAVRIPLFSFAANLSRNLR